MTMAKRKLSTGGNIYFTLDNYGRRKAHKFGDGGHTIGTTVDSSGNLISEDVDIKPLDINTGEKTETGSSGNPLKTLSKMTTAFKLASEYTNRNKDFKPQVDYLSMNQGVYKGGMFSDIGMSADMTGQLIEGISNLRDKRVPLAEKVGLINSHALGGRLFGEGGSTGGKGISLEQGMDLATTGGALIGNAINQAQTADTRSLEKSIVNTGNMQVSASNNDELMNAWGQRRELNTLKAKDLWSKNIGQAIGNQFSASGQGMAAGSAFGPWGAGIGAAIGGTSSIIGSVIGMRKANKQKIKLNRKIRAANARQDRTLTDLTSNVDTNNDLTAMRNYAALGGPLSMYSPYAFGVQGPLEYALMQEDLDIKQQKADNAGESSLSGLTFGKGGGIHINPKNKGKLTATSKRTGKSFSELAHSKNPLTRKRAIFALNARKWHHGKKHAFGGDLESNGANWDLGFTSIGNGGTHEMNPYEGVQMGMDSKGIPNLVEQGEIVYNDYVFSNRLTATPSLLQAYNLPKKYRGLTFSEMADKISGEVKERPNDPISQKDFENNMQRLELAQEAVRKAQQQQQAIQQAALMQQAQQYAAQQQAQQQAYQNALAQQAYNNQQLGAMQGMVSPEEQMGLGQYGCGGGLKFARGGNLYGIGSWFRNKPINSSVKSYKNWEKWFGGYNQAVDEFGQPIYMDAEGNDIMYDNDGVPDFGSNIDAYRTWAEGQGYTPKLNETDWVNEFTKEDSTLDYDQVSRMLELAQSGNTDAQKWLGDNFPGMTQSQWAAITAAQNKAPIYSTMGRNAPIYGDIAAGLINGIWGNKQDYANKIQAAADAARVPERVEWNPVGNYLQYRPFDTQYALNQLNSQFGATNRAAINNANGNRATAMANLLASQHNYGNQVGGLYAQALQYNDAQRKATEEFNRATNLANSEGFLKADMANQAERRAGLNSALQGTVYAQNMANDNYYNWLSNMTKGIGNFMGDIGAKAKENMAFNMVNSGKGNMYFNTADGVVGYLGSPYNNTQLAQRARGGYLTMPDRQIRRRRR